MSTEIEVKSKFEHSEAGWCFIGCMNANTWLFNMRLNVLWPQLLPKSYSASVYVPFEVDNYILMVNDIIKTNSVPGLFEKPMSISTICRSASKKYCLSVLKLHDLRCSMVTYGTDKEISHLINNIE